jgi:hypothetical protein
VVAQARRYRKDPKRLAQVVPSLVTPAGEVYKPAYNAFEADALASASLALRLPAAKEAQRMINVLSGKDKDTVIAAMNHQHADAYLAEAERDTRPIWHDISHLLGQARADL